MKNKNKKNSQVNIFLYSSIGELVDKIYSNDLASSTHTFRYYYNSLTSGVYFMIMETGNEWLSRKIILLK
jgi:hypothetical protein